MVGLKLQLQFSQGAVHKIRPQTGGGGLFSLEKGEGSSSNATSVLFGAKNFGFFVIYGVSAQTRKRGFSQCEHGGGQFFPIFSFMDGQKLQKFNATIYM